MKTPKLVGRDAVLKLLRERRDSWKANKRLYPRHSPTWRVSDEAVGELEEIMRKVRAMAEEKP